MKKIALVGLVSLWLSGCVGWGALPWIDSKDSAEADVGGGALPDPKGIVPLAATYAVEFRCMFGCTEELLISTSDRLHVDLITGAVWTWKTTSADITGAPGEETTQGRLTGLAQGCYYVAWPNLYQDLTTAICPHPLGDLVGSVEIYGATESSTYILHGYEIAAE